jgi:hypothetical protein
VGLLLLNGGGERVALLGRVEHERLVQPRTVSEPKILYEMKSDSLSQANSFGLCLLKTSLQLLLRHLKVTNVRRCTVEQGDLARLLI